MKIIQDTENSRFVAMAKEKPIGYLVYRIEENGDYSALSTQVQEKHQHEGVGKALVDAIVAHTQSLGTHTIAVCPYVVAIFERYPDRYQQ